MKLLCFSLMPCGRMPAGDGRAADFAMVYEGFIEPAR